MASCKIESRKKVGVISLGCDKNRVDTEKMLAKLEEKFTLTSDMLDAEIIVVNTCAFLNSSRKEAIDETLSANEARKNGKLEKLVMTGCLPEYFINETFSYLTEVDVFLGVNDYTKINDAIDLAYKGVRVNLVGLGKAELGEKRVLTTDNYAYLKIADGCSNHCTYCLIPSIRGKYHSYAMENLISEAKGLGEIKELILVAQDITKYGSDYDNGVTLVTLISELSKLKNIKKIRLLYCYPENITDALIAEIKNNDKVIKYIDMPLQHADDRILKLMNRKGTYESYLALIKKLKAEIENIAVRSTFIAGFPSEDEEAFNNLLNFLKEAKLVNAGFFEYSREKGTAAYKMKNQVLARTKKSRKLKLYKTQKLIVAEYLKGYIGKNIEVMIDGFNGLCYEARAYFNAPDIDGKVYLTSGKELKNGETYMAKISDFKDYDLYGSIVL